MLGWSGHCDAHEGPGHSLVGGYQVSQSPFRGFWGLGWMLLRLLGSYILITLATVQQLMHDPSFENLKGIGDAFSSSLIVGWLILAF